MSRTALIVTLAALGLVLAVVVGVAADSQSDAEKNFCKSMDSLQSAANNLTTLNGSSLSQGEIQSDVSTLQNAWGDVKSDAGKVHKANIDNLQSAWSDFTSSIKNVTDAASLSAA